MLTRIVLLALQNNAHADEIELAVKGKELPAGMYAHHFIMYEFMLCSAVSVALLLLLLWHAHLINKAETSIEMHINRSEAARCKEKGIVGIILHCFASV